MKNAILVISFFVLQLGFQNSLTAQSTPEKTPFSTDSLFTINYSYYQDKTLEELLEHDILSQYSDVYINPTCSGNLGRIEFHYPHGGDFSVNIGLRYPFQFFDESKYKRNEMPLLEEILKERIGRIFLGHPIFIEVSLAQTIEEEQDFLQALSEINFEDYYGQPVRKLLSLPVFSRYSWAGFSNKKDDAASDCLDSFTFSYRLKTRHVWMGLYPESECLNMKKKPAGIRNEILKRVKINPSLEELLSTDK